MATTALPLETAARPHVLRAHEQHGVAVDELPFVIDQDRAIAVAVERDAEAEAVVPHEFGERFRMRRSAMQVDVASVGLVADHGDVEAELAEQTRRDGRRGAVRAVERDAGAAQG